MDLALAKRGVEIASTLEFDNENRITNDLLDHAIRPLVELLKIAIDIELLDEDSYDKVFMDCNHWELGMDAVAALAKLQADDAIKTIVAFANKITKIGYAPDWNFERFPNEIQNFTPSAAETLMQEVLNPNWNVDTRIGIMAGVVNLANKEAGAKALIVPWMKQGLEDAANQPIRINTALMTASIELGLIELAEDIERAFSIDRIDCGMIGNWDVARRDLQVPGIGLQMPKKPYDSRDELRAFLGVGCFSKVPVFMLNKVQEEEAQAYLKTAQTVFERSPQGKAVLKENERAWIVQKFLLIGVYDLGVTVDRMSLNHINAILLSLFPSKVILEAEYFGDTIDILVAFWQFVDCVHHIESAAPIANHIANLRWEFRNAMSNPRNFELAKDLTTMGQAAGFDMSTQEETKATMKSQNETVVGYQEKPLANSSYASQDLRRADQPHLLDSQNIVSSMNRKQRNSLLDKKRKNKKGGDERGHSTMSGGDTWVPLP